MFDKKSLAVAVLSFATVFGLQLLFRNWSGEGEKTNAHVHQVGGAYKIPSVQDLSLPAVKTVAFDNGAGADVETVAVDLGHYQATFSTAGAVLSSLAYPAYTDASGAALQGVTPPVSPEQGSFVLALGEESPLHYRCEGVQKQENGDASVSFFARTADWEVRKTFTLHHEVYLVDVAIAVKARSSRASVVRPRLFIGAPCMPSLAKDVAKGVVLDADKNVLGAVSDVQRASDAWVTPALIGVEDSYFAHILVADHDHFVQRGYFTGPECSWVSAILEGAPVAEASECRFSFYVGPKSLKPLMAVDNRLEGLLNFGWLSWIAKHLLAALTALYDWCHDYGLAIILLTLLLKLILLPLSWKSASYMEVQQRLQPRVAALRKKYGNDTATFNAELMRLYQEHNVSPASFMLGCLLMVPQWPLFFAMYRVLGNVVDLYQAPFFGWITDLSAKDPYYILPAAVVVLTFLQPMGAMKGDSSTKALRYLMPLLLSAVFVSMPAGLLLFIMTNFLVSLLEQRVRKFVSA